MDIVTILLYILGFLVFLVLTQDINIFPGAFLSKAKFWQQRDKKIPAHVESVFVEAKDRALIEVWRYAHAEQSPFSSYVALICHGNGGAVENYLFVQMWLAELGITSYSFDYRGFGRSSGWPNERGIYVDTETVWDYLVEREQADPSRIIIVGISVGSAPAARIAAKYQPKLLLLSSAFTSLRETVRAQPIIGFLSPLVWSKFPTIEYVRELKTTNLLLAYGLNDSIVPNCHSPELEAAYRGEGKSVCLASRTAGHNMAFYDLKDDLRAAISNLL